MLTRVSLRNVLGKFAERSDEVRRALANLFLVCALDGLDQGQPQAAREFLAQSKTLYQELPGQEQLQRMLSSGTPEQIATATPAPVRQNQLFDREASVEPEALVEESGAMSFLFVVLLLFLVFAAGFVLFLFSEGSFQSGRSS